jgi:N-glycosylase/DNA lyase
MKVDNFVNVKEIEKAVIGVSSHIENANMYKVRWYELSEEQLWLELVSCILGSRVLYETVSSCVSYLYQQKLLRPSIIIAEPDKIEKKLANELSRPIFSSFKKNKECRYPYPESRSGYIVQTAVEIYKNNGTNLRDILANCRNECEARESIRKKSKGIGYKQASLFLRNISFSENLAILDSHIIKYMILMNIIGDTKDLNISTRHTYVRLEGNLLDYAISKNKPISTLDMAIWVVMRLVQREFIIWQW